MTTYSLACRVVVSAYTEVEADSLDDAIEIAHCRSVHMHGYGHKENEAWIVDDMDGDPQQIEEA
jgi:O-glycosyl hydrolase